MSDGCWNFARITNDQRRAVLPAAARPAVIDAGDVIYIPAGYYRGLRAKDASTLLIYGFAPSSRKGRDTDQDDISSPAPHPEDLLDESSSSELGV